MTDQQQLAGVPAFSDFRPVPIEDADPAPDFAAARAIAEAHGFVPRSAAPLTRRKRKRPEGAVCSFTARISVEAADRFVEFAERERLSYRAAFDRLVALIDRA